MESIKSQFTPKQMNDRRMKESILFRSILVIFVIVGLIGFPRTLRGEYLHISMKRYPCMGNCPFYTIDVYGSGLVIYHGDHYVKDEGYRIGFITQEQIQELVETLNSSQYFSLDNSYHFNVTDNPGTTIYTKYEEAEKEISHYPDGRSYHDIAPSELGALESQVEDIARPWIGK
jgi:hypothetical protein